MMGASLAFSYALVPQVLHGFRTRSCGVSAQTSAITTAGLCVLAVCGATLGLWFSASVWTLTAALWATLLVQRIRYGDDNGQARPAGRTHSERRR